MNYTVERLPNGLTLILKELRSTPVITFQAWVKVGSADETPKEAGLAHVFEHILFKGTKRRGVGEIVRDVEQAGGYINAWTSHDETVFHVTLASRFKDQGLDIMADAIQNASIAGEELERELLVIREEIRMGKDSPHRSVIEELLGSAFRQHPYGRPVIGYDQTVKSFTSEVVSDFYRRWYVAKNVVFIVCGDFDTQSMLKKASAALCEMPAGQPPKRSTRVAEPPQRSSRFAYAVKPISEAHLAIGFPIPGLVHPDIAALDLLATVLGQGASSRLETTVKRRLGLVSGIRAMAYSPCDAGIFTIVATLPSHNLKKAVSAVTAEVARLANERIPLSELEKARSLIESESIYSEETVDGVARKVGFWGLHTGDPDFEARHMARMSAVGPSDLIDAAGKYFAPNRASVSVVLPDPAHHKPDRPVQWTKSAGKGRDGINAKTLRRVVINATEEGWKAGSRKAGRRRSSIAEIRKLSNGDVLIVRTVPTSRLVSLKAAFIGGSRHEKASHAGISILLANALTRGTKSRSAEEVSRAMDALACSISGFSGRNTFGVQAEVLARSFDESFELMAECLTGPALLQDEIAREKELLVEDIRANNDSPSHQAFRIMQEAMFGKHPYGRPLTGTEQTLSKIEPDAMRRYLNSVTAAGSMVLAAAGGVDADTATLAAERYLAKRSGTGASRPSKAAMRWKEPELPRQVVRSMKKEQSHVVIGFPGIDVLGEDRFDLEVLIEIMGSHGGRLFDSIREKLGLAYSVTATSMEGIDKGYVAMYAATSPGKEHKVVEAMLKEVKLARERRPLSEELTRIKRHLIGSKAIEMQRSSSQASGMALGYIYGTGYDSDIRYPDQIEAVTRNSVAEAAVRYLDPGKMIIACAGPNAEKLNLLKND